MTPIRRETPQQAAPSVAAGNLLLYGWYGGATTSGEPYKMVVSDFPVARPSMRFIEAEAPAVEIAQLRVAIDALTSEVRRLRHLIDERLPSSGEEDESRMISDDQARTEIVEALRSTSAPLYPSDLAEALSIDFDQVRRVLASLHSEGLVATGPENER